MNNSLIKCLLILAPMVVMAGVTMAQTDYSLRSPDQKIEVKIRIGDRLRYDVSFNGRTLLQDATLSLTVDEKTLGVSPRVKAARERSHEGIVEPVVRQKAAKLREAYRELRLEMEGDYAVVFRAYPEGVAYRWETTWPAAQVKVTGEEALFNFAGNYTVWYPQEEGFHSHNERFFLPRSLREIAPAAIASLPAVVDAGDGAKIAIGESDIEEYPGLWLRGTSSQALAGLWPPYPLKEKAENDRDIKVTETANYLAVTKGNRAYPWRLLGLAEKDADLISNSLVYLLASPSRIQDTSWIKPGKVAWDWWNALNLQGVDFKAGVNTQTYRYFIDFAAKHGIEYIVLDEGWYKLGNVLEVVPEIDLPALTAYAKQKNVGVILWVIWKTLDNQLIPALDQFEKWGVKGIKVDFMQRDDQPVIEFYHKLCREAAQRKMLIDYHGGIRPAIMTRTWPNLISTEGVRGMEWLKWSADSHPEHNVTLPFTRMFLGPMDYTPGAMVNAAKGTFAPIFQRPMSLGTRGHQLAMYVVFESPLQMLSDSPTNYLREPEIMEFLGPVPSVWDETKALDGKIGDFVVVARRRGNDWYLAAMTDWTAREIEIDCSFLPAGQFKLTAYEDGLNANRFGNDYRKSMRSIDRTTKLKIRLAEGGGWAGRIQTPRDTRKK